MTRAFMWLVAALALSACNKAVESYVTGVNPDNGLPHDTGPLPAIGPMELKTGPFVSSKGSSSLALKANITPTDRLVKSGTMSARLTLQRQKVTP